MYIGDATYSRWQGEAGPVGAWLNPALLAGTMAIQGNKQPRYYTKNKTYGGALCSMGRGTGSLSSVAKRTHPGRHTWVTR
jgi:hypothetical protein